MRAGFVVYSRRGCHLCEVLIEALIEEIGGSEIPEIRDIDTNPEWAEAFGTRIPVLEYDGEWLCDYHLDRAKVRSVLAHRDAG